MLPINHSKFKEAEQIIKLIVPLFC